MTPEAEAYIIESMQKAEQEADNLLDGKSRSGSDNITLDDLLMLYRWQLARRMGVGVFSDYITNLTPEQLRFELQLHLASDPEYRRQKHIADYTKAAQEQPMFAEETQWEDLELSDEQALAKAQEDFRRIDSAK